MRVRPISTVSCTGIQDHVDVVRRRRPAPDAKFVNATGDTCSAAFCHLGGGLGLGFGKRGGPLAAIRVLFGRAALSADIVFSNQLMDGGGQQ